jgi:hypothetical protein
MVLRGEEGSTDILAPGPTRPFGPAQFRKVVTPVAIVGGAGLVIFALGWIPGLHNERGSLGELAIYAGAAYMLAIGGVIWYWFGRIASRQAIRLSVSSGGLDAVLANHVRLAASWSDPSLEGEMTDWSPGAMSPLRFDWKVGGNRAYARITREGSALLEAGARRNNLRVETVVKGTPPRTWAVTRLRHQ